jgi:hypothetical protein
LEFGSGSSQNYTDLPQKNRFHSRISPQNFQKEQI